MVAPNSTDTVPPGNKATRRWDATAHEALLLCVIDEVKGGKAFLTEVTRRMQARGYSYSYDAIKYTFLWTNLSRLAIRGPLLTYCVYFSQHVQKLRKNRDTAGIVTATEPGTAGSKTSTPRKTATTRKRRTPSKKEIVADEEDDEMNLKLEEFAEGQQLRSPSIRPSKRAKSVASFLYRAMGDEMDGEAKLEPEY
ncbi:hypothetical protein TARUN_1229 [Trichoderma arundinaceum]|uniref:Uncharacterized protein n=1 Tax=Trichoderma arundinaceum TaxID=490622 RepID=A0A395NY01_TRIAR|nr:hypothetical protein TARUN_1229 [Trichoderma arundinaceum]